MIVLTCREGYRGPDWDGPIVRPTRNWESVILPSESKEDIFSDVQSFLNKEERDWYASKGECLPLCSDRSVSDGRYSSSAGVSWIESSSTPRAESRYFLHGPPGAGKTTLGMSLGPKHYQYADIKQSPRWQANLVWTFTASTLVQLGKPIVTFTATS